MRFRELKLRKDPACPVCGENPSVRELIDYERFCGVPPHGTEEQMEDGIPEITATELKQRLDRGERIDIVDVREDHEWEIGNLGPYGARLIPLGEIADRTDEIDPDVETVVLCRSGGRSGRAIEFLQGRGHARLTNLKGGMLAWSDEVDPTIPKY